MKSILRVAWEGRAGQRTAAVLNGEIEETDGTVSRQDINQSAMNQTYVI